MGQGLGTQVIFILISWFSTVIYLMSPQIAYDYGVLGVIGFAAMGVISFSLFYLWRAKRIHDKPKVWIRSIVHFLYLIETFSFLLLVIKIVLGQSFWAEGFVYISLVCAVSVIIIGFTRKWFVKWIAAGVVVLGMIASFLIPTLVYFNISIPTVYSGIHFLATDMLRLDAERTWLLIPVMGISILVHHYLIYLHGGVEQIRIPKRFFAYLMASLLWAFVPVSLGSLSFVAKAQAIWPELADHVSIQVIEQFGGQFGKSLFLMTLVITIIYEIFRIKDACLEFYRLHPKSTIILLLVPVGIILLPHLTLFDVMIYFSLLWGPLLPVMVWSNQDQRRSLLALAIGVLTSITLALLGKIFVGILLGTLLSGLLIIPWAKGNRAVLGGTNMSPHPRKTP